MALAQLSKEMWPQALTKSRLPVEFDVCDTSLLVDECVGVHSKALHVAVIQWHPNVILEEGELHRQTSQL